MNPILFRLSLVSAVVLSGCATAPDQMSSSTEICDVKEPVLGSRVAEKVRCAPTKKTATQPAV